MTTGPTEGPSATLAFKPAGIQGSHRFTRVFRILGRIEKARGDAGGDHLVDLILHQSDQRRNDDRQP